GHGGVFLLVSPALAVADFVRIRSGPCDSRQNSHEFCYLSRVLLPLTSSATRRERATYFPPCGVAFPPLLPPPLPPLLLPFCGMYETRGTGIDSRYARRIRSTSWAEPPYG